jgi:hypothetical protein
VAFILFDTGAGGSFGFAPKDRRFQIFPPR